MHRPRLALFALFIALPAYAEQPRPAPPTPAASGQMTCTEPRPEVCTREYRPVCGTKRDGARQTYGNGCSACGDRNVVGHVPGPCS